jgi:hypothetical protein
LGRRPHVLQCKHNGEKCHLLACDSTISSRVATLSRAQVLYAANIYCHAHTHGSLQTLHTSLLLSCAYVSYVYPLPPSYLRRDELTRLYTKTTEPWILHNTSCRTSTTLTPRLRSCISRLPTNPFSRRGHSDEDYTQRQEQDIP